jgi:hypothetical protein
MRVMRKVRSEMEGSRGLGWRAEEAVVESEQSWHVVVGWLWGLVGGWVGVAGGVMLDGWEVLIVWVGCCCSDSLFVKC